MITIAEITESLIRKSPFLEEALSDGLINVSSLARMIKPDIEKKLQKPIKEGAIVMAINRISPSKQLKVKRVLNTFIQGLGDFTVRSNLSTYTFKNSPTLFPKQAKILQMASERKDLFCTVSQGINESTVTVSNASGVIKIHIAKLLDSEEMTSHEENVSSITVVLPQGSTEVAGIYYFILKKLAWEGININEIISTTNEFTFVFNDNVVDKAFSVLLKMKNER